jgi:hypothetical protein
MTLLPPGRYVVCNGSSSSQVVKKEERWRRDGVEEKDCPHRQNGRTFVSPNTKTDTGEPVIYQIRIKGHLDRRWTDWFEGLTITQEDNGDTLLTGPVVDQAALYGLLRKVRDLGMPLISAIRLRSPS